MESAHDAPEARPSVEPAHRRATESVERDEYLLVGGGLHNALLALAVLDRKPTARLTLVEREHRLGGNHTWCFHQSDVPAEAMRWLGPLVVQRWPAHDVAFPSHRRRIPGGYAALTSERLHQVVSERLARAPHARLLHSDVREVRPGGALLQSGSWHAAELVVDARGPGHARPAPGGFQKFVGLELKVEAGSAPELPVLMDATVAQLDGFRFMYVLPWAADRVLVEDTYYSESPELAVPTLRERVLDYAGRSGLRVQAVLRQEHGVLPIPTRLELGHTPGEPLSAGYAGGLFHPTTGYSLPVAVRLALFVAERSTAAAQGNELTSWLDAHRRQVTYCLWLNRLLFSAFAPAERFHVLERFYRLPEATIRRFYALELSRADRARILCGRPPRGFSLTRLLADARAARGLSPESPSA